MNSNTMFKISYGLYVLFTNCGKKMNGCIINTVNQVTSQPNRITIAVSNANYSCETIKKTGFFNISILSEKAKFDIFKRFGFATGKDTDKLKDFLCDTANNGLPILKPDVSNGWLSCKVTETKDLGSHTLFLADVLDAEIISKDESMTYAYYHANVKPKPKADETSKDVKKKGFRCVICGFVYEGETLPPDYICPLCKHGVDAFVPL